VTISSSLAADARNPNADVAVASNSIVAGCVEGAASGHRVSVVAAGVCAALAASANSVPVPICSSRERRHGASELDGSRDRDRQQIHPVQGARGVLERPVAVDHLAAPRPIRDACRVRGVSAGRAADDGDRRRRRLRFGRLCRGLPCSLGDVEQFRLQARCRGDGWADQLRRTQLHSGRHGQDRAGERRACGVECGRIDSRGRHPAGGKLGQRLRDGVRVGELVLGHHQLWPHR
jgi:hypothetical protein